MSPVIFLVGWLACCGLVAGIIAASEGRYGMPEMWACSECMRNAEPGSKMAQLRDDLYAEDFQL